MNSLKKAALFCGYILTGLIILHLTAFEVLAAENSGDWRPIFDLVMRWVNFLILAFLLIKFSSAPIKKFFDGRRQDIADEIGVLEAEKEKMLGQIEESKQQLESSQERLSALKQKIIAQGETIRQTIIEQAQQESKMMLLSAKQKMDSRIVEASQVLKMELVDMAIALAIDLLPGKITEEDNQKFIDAFISNVSPK